MAPPTVTGSARPGAALSLVFRRQAGAAGRDPGPFFFLPAMPALLMTVVSTALFDRISEVPGYDGGDHDAFLIPGVVVMVALLGAVPPPRAWRPISARATSTGSASSRPGR
jgi:hypothetical protein